ncbi:hypothetical protein EDB85DRAFT_2149046 [Lactarius pseudohatsudake]|nr:hypothetical protein EDB85DRAFT_2149046 [Lactarius pseudohatsudake]
MSLLAAPIFLERSRSHGPRNPLDPLRHSHPSSVPYRSDVGEKHFIQFYEKEVEPRDMADFLRTEASNLYSQGFATIPCMGLRISRSPVRWLDHDILKRLEDVLLSVEKGCRKRCEPLTRRFMVTQGIFEKDGATVDLPKLIELRHRDKYPHILIAFLMGAAPLAQWDEPDADADLCSQNYITSPYASPLFCFVVCRLNSTACRTATQIDMIIGSVANGRAELIRRFYAGSRIVVDHQRINDTSLVFSAAVPAENVRAILAVLDWVGAITIPSHVASPTIHIHLRSVATLSASASASAKPPNPATPAPRNAPSIRHHGACGSRGRGGCVGRSSSRHARASGSLSRKDSERAAGVIKATVAKAPTKRK